VPQPAAPAKPVVVEVPKAAPVPVAKTVEQPKALPGPVAALPPAPSAKLPPTMEAAPGKAGPKYNDLMTAVMVRDAGAVDELLRLGKWVDKPDSNGLTPLMAAAMIGDAATAETLLRAGANPAMALPVARERRNAAMTALLERYATSKRP
jgi:hypothetical protein